MSLVGRAPRELPEPSYKRWSVYKSNKRYSTPLSVYFDPSGYFSEEEYPRLFMTYSIMSNSGGQRPFTSRFWLGLRLWIRKARRAAFNRALVRHHIPTLLGKRKVR